MEKTNVMRHLESNNIAYQAHSYSTEDGLIDGLSVAKKLNHNPEQVFKTLLTQAPDHEILVFIVPVAAELDFKKAARAAKVKSIEMAPVKDILKISGYMKGGCSPLCMKRKYRTFMDETAILYDTIIVSAGKIGAQIELNGEDLMNLATGEFVDLLKE